MDATLHPATRAQRRLADLAKTLVILALLTIAAVIWLLTGPGYLRGAR